MTIQEVGNNNNNHRVEEHVSLDAGAEELESFMFLGDHHGGSSDDDDDDRGHDRQGQTQRNNKHPSYSPGDNTNSNTSLNGQDDNDDDIIVLMRDVQEENSDSKGKAKNTKEANDNNNDDEDEDDQRSRGSWYDYDEKGPWHVPEGAAMIVKQMAAEVIFLDLVDCIVDDTRKPNHAAIFNLLQQFPGLCHRTYQVQWDRQYETRDLYPLSILACLQPPLPLMKFVHAAYPAALSHQETAKHTMPFHYACTFQASLDVVNWMMECNREFVQMPRKDGMYPLHLAVFFKAPLPVVDRLLQVWPTAAEQSYAGEWSILHAAAAGQASLDLVQRLYRYNPAAVRALDERRRTPLHQACWKRGNVEVVRFLVECAPETLHLEDDASETPLFRAARNQSLEVMQYLLSTFAAVPAANTDNNAEGDADPAAEGQAPPVAPAAAPAAAAAAGGAPPLDDLGANLLHFAALDNSVDVVEYLLHKHPEMAVGQTTCRDRYTPLHSAMHCPLDRDNLPNVQALVRHFPQTVTLRNGDGRTPLETAREVGTAAPVVTFLESVTPASAQTASKSQRPNRIEDDDEDEDEEEDEEEGVGVVDEEDHDDVVDLQDGAEELAIADA